MHTWVHMQIHKMEPTDIDMQRCTHMATHMHTQKHAHRYTYTHTNACAQ